MPKSKYKAKKITPIILFYSLEVVLGILLYFFALSFLLLQSFLFEQELLVAAQSLFIVQEPLAVALAAVQSLLALQELEASAFLLVGALAVVFWDPQDSADLHVIFKSFFRANEFLLSSKRRKINKGKGG